MGEADQISQSVRPLSSPTRQAFHGIEVRIEGQKRKRVLNGRRRYPHIVGRYRPPDSLELEANLGGVAGGLFVVGEYPDLLHKLGQISQILRSPTRV